MVMGGGTAHWLGPGRTTGKSEVMQTAKAAVFARMPSGQDSPKTHSLHWGLNAPPAASQASVPEVAPMLDHA